MVTICYKNEKNPSKLLFLQDFRFYQWSSHNREIYTSKEIVIFSELTTNTSKTNCHFSPKLTTKFVLFTLNTKFLPKHFTKMYKFWIKTVVLYPKMYIWSWKNKIFVLFTLKMKFLPNNFTKMYKFWIKTVLLYPKMYFGSEKCKENVLSTLKMKFLSKNFTKMYKFCIKTVVLYPKMYIWSQNNKKICTFYSKNEVFAKQFH